MIDLHLLRNDDGTLQKRILSKDPSFPYPAMMELDNQVKVIRLFLEELRKQKNNLAAQGAHGITDTLRQQSIALGTQIKEEEKKLHHAEEELKKILLSCPNIPAPDLPEGFKEANKVVKIVGDKQVFSFQPKHHVELNEKLNWFDFQAGASMSGTNFVVYKNDGAKLLYALTHLMIRNNVKHGFSPVIPPYLVKEQALYNSGNLPKFAGDYYSTQDETCLIPTAEVSLTNLHAQSILSKEQLPLRYTAWTSCFRREAGTHGATERGLIRIHQFEKVELYTLCTPEESGAELNRMLASVEDLMQSFGLHYRISLLATQDSSFCSAKTYDVEVWLPGQNAFYEVSSCSNCTDFQARRAQIRFRKSADDKPQLVHTLNGSSLALPRLMVALIEQYQQADGSIRLPKIIQDAMQTLW